MIKKIVLSFACGLGIVLLLQHIIAFRPGLLEQTGAIIAHPFLATASRISTFVQSFQSKKIAYAQLHSDHIRLRKQYDELFASYLALRATSRFNDATQELIDFRQRYNFDQAILGKILTRTINASEHTAIINRGSAHGIRNDMVAIYKLQVVGRVYECYPTMCKIMLITDKRCKVAGFTNATSAGGIVMGTNEPQRCVMMFVSHLSDIIDEDFVFSSGQGMVFPEGFCLGKIVTHSHAEKEVYHSITLEPLIDFQDLRYCLLSSQEMINLF